MNFRILPPAQIDLTQAAEFYEKESPGLSDELLFQFQQSVDQLLIFPNLGRPLDETTRKIDLRVFPFDIIYKTPSKEIIIIAFAHHSRKPGYWKKRS